MHSFQHITPPLRLFSGPDSMDFLGRELMRLDSRRAVVFSGPWARGRMLDAVRTAIGERCAGVFEGVVAHSPVASVEAAARELKRLDADAVIALGGGSSIVTARAGSILAAEGKDPRSLCTTRDADGKLHSPKLLAPKLPQLIVPTTPTTAMVKAGSAVFDPESGERLAMYDPKTRAHAIFIHPEFIASSPRDLIVSASLNTFAMAMEGLMSRTGDPIADALLMHALRLLAQRLPGNSLDADLDAPGDLMLAAVLCGQGSDYAAAGITTVLGHAVGARFHLDNGLVNAIVLPHVLRFNADAASAGLAKISAALGLPAGTDAEAIIASVEALLSQLGVPRRLRDVRVPRESLPEVATHAMGDWFLRGNPRPVREVSELQRILDDVW